jgi:hypothetical protein
MTDYDFIPPEVYETLPDDQAEQFLLLAEIAEQNFRQRHASASGGKADAQRKAYIGQLNALSTELGFGALPFPEPGTVTDAEWSAFQSGLTAVKTKIRLRLRKSSDFAMRPLGIVTRARIEQEIERLRRLIADSDMDDYKKSILNAKLDELYDELRRERLNFVKIATVVAAVAAAIGGSTATLADGPEAFESVGRILRWIGEANDEPPQKALPKPAKELSGPKG